jgi:hypothetical protein
MEDVAEPTHAAIKDDFDGANTSNRSFGIVGQKNMLR